MPRKSTKTANTPTRNTTRTTSATRRRAASKAKGANNIITRESLAADLAAFRKQGGRIDVLGTTPIRRQVRGSAFSSRNSQRKAPTKPTVRATAKR